MAAKTTTATTVKTTDDTTTGEPTTAPVVVATTVPPVVALPANESEIIARLKVNATNGAKLADSIREDLTVLTTGKNEQEIAELARELGAYRLGHVTGVKAITPVIASLADTDRAGGKIAGKTIASLLGISEASVSALKSVKLDDETDGQAKSKKTNAERAIDSANALVKALGKIEPTDLDEILIGALFGARGSIGKTLKTTTNNRGGQA